MGRSKATSLSAPLRVAVVERSPGMRDLLVARLVHRGHHVCAGATLDQALARLRGGLPDVLVIDVGPERSGTALNLQLRRLATRGVSVLLTVGMGDRLSADRARAQGVAAVVAKPYDVDRLVRTVQELGQRDSMVA